MTEDSDAILNRCESRQSCLIPEFGGKVLLETLLEPPSQAKWKQILFESGCRRTKGNSPVALSDGWRGGFTGVFG